MKNVDVIAFVDNLIEGKDCVAIIEDLFHFVPRGDLNYYSLLIAGFARVAGYMQIEQRHSEHKAMIDTINVFIALRDLDD